jgi:hypothetical protein
MDYLQKINIDFELHSVDGIRECFKSGVNSSGAEIPPTSADI